MQRITKSRRQPRPTRGRFIKFSDRKSSATAGRFKKSNGHVSNRRKRVSRSATSRPARYRGRSAAKRGFSRGGAAPLDIAYFIRQASSSQPKEHIIKHEFADFGFMAKIQHNLKTLGYITPTPIQDQSIPLIMRGADVVGLANTGTGKTGAFLLPLIDKIGRDRTKKALIIAPTRELAQQIDSEFRKFSAGMQIFSAVCIGGLPIVKQLKSLKRRPNIVIGTPGRLADMYQRKAVRLGEFSSVVLDEVDRMLDMGFIDSIRKILAQIPARRQSLFFSATVPPAISQLVQQFLSKPVTITVSSGQAAHNVEQDVIKVPDRASKLERLKEILARPELKKVLIFSKTKREVERLTQDLYHTGFKVDSIHGDKRQHQRQKSLTRFRNSQINILVATDVAARGLDIKNVTHVINYTIPQTYDDYIHRIGRTGRGTSKGIALTFV